ncbi:MAG: hypothetical protein NE328_10400 [Lentisphaeraceae bacterium]|nr:hypothetical protein [Lentisphaeraceae bacterium]
MLEELLKEEISNEISSYIHYETNILQILIDSMTKTPSPKALELRNGDRLAIIYSQNSRIVHAIETDRKMKGEGFIGKDAILAIRHYDMVKFKEFHCDPIAKPTLDLLPEEVFDRAVIEENMDLQDIAKMISHYSYVEMGLFMNEKLQGHQIFYTNAPESFGKLSQQLLNYIKKLIINLQSTHLEMPDNLQIKLKQNSFKTALIKQYGDDFIVLFLSKSVIDDQLKISFNDF